MKKYKVGFLCGFFDPLHDGHIDIMKQAKAMCEQLIVAVGTDDFMLRRKHHGTILSYEQRVEIISAIRYVDRVVPETDLNKIEAYNKYHFDVMFAGDDHLTESIYQEAKMRLAEMGVDTVFVQRKKKVSSTLLRERTVEVMEKW